LSACVQKWSALPGPAKIVCGNAIPATDPYIYFIFCDLKEADSKAIENVDLIELQVRYNLMKGPDGRVFY
jgi:hypothetical protein